MRRQERKLALLMILSLFLFISGGCSAGESSRSGGGGDVSPIVDQEARGVWLGALWNTTGVDEDLVSIINTTFSVGIVTRDGQAVLIADNIQFVADGVEKSLQVGDAWTWGLGQILEGRFDVNTWDTTGVGLDPYYCNIGEIDSDNLASREDYFFGGVYTNFLLWSTFREQSLTGGGFSYIYNSTYEVSPNVGDLEGTWIARDIFMTGETLGLTITLPSQEDTTYGTITGGDSFGKVFDGEITIHYTTENEVEGNIYDVTLSFDEVEMNGLATYVEEWNTQGIDINKRTLALGVSNQELGYMINILTTLAN